MPYGTTGTAGGDWYFKGEGIYQLLKQLIMENFSGISGPWKISEEPCRVDQDGDDGIDIDTDWEDENDGQVNSFITVWGNNESYKKTAKLIVAAPALLEALQELVDIIPSVNMEHQEARSKAINAINKALL